MSLSNNGTELYSVGGRTSQIVGFGSEVSRHIQDTIPEVLTGLKGWQMGLIILVIAIAYDQGMGDLYPF